MYLLLHDTSGEALTAIAPALRTAWRAAQVEPFILKPAEVERLARVFPAKLLDIQAHHIALAGEDPFAGLEVAREPLRLHLEQSLRNLALRLRRRYVAVFDDPAALAQALANITIPLKVDLTGLLRLAQKGEPAEATSAAVFAAAAAAFSLDGAALARLAALRQQTQLPDDLPGLYQSVAATVAQAAEVADRLKESQ